MRASLSRKLRGCQAAEAEDIESVAEGAWVGDEPA